MPELNLLPKYVVTFFYKSVCGAAKPSGAPHLRRSVVMTALSYGGDGASASVCGRFISCRSSAGRRTVISVAAQIDTPLSLADLHQRSGGFERLSSAIWVVPKRTNDVGLGKALCTKLH